MSPDSSDQARSVAVEQLRALGLSTYAARTFAALVELGEGTARDVSDVAEVPRTRVYDAVEELRDRGLVDVQQSTPKRFWAISAETTGRQFEQEYTHRVEVLTEALDGIETRPRPDEQRGVWTVTGRDTVDDRIAEFVETADEEVVYMTVEELLTDGLVDRLEAAVERDVTIRLAGMSPAVEQEMGTTVPGAETFESLWDWSDTPAGRLLMVDGTRTLVSVLAGGDGDSSPEPRGETAIWGSGRTNGLVVVLRAMFTWKLDGNRD